MIKTHRVKLKLNKSQTELVREKQMESANCQNHIVNLSKEYYFEHKQWIKKNDIQKLIKGKYNLHSQTVQAISDKFDANRKTISALRKNVKENYTSQICPKCSKKHKPTGRTYRCTCGYETHRDIIGAWNILNKKHKCEHTRLRQQWRRHRPSSLTL